MKKKEEKYIENKWKKVEKELEYVASYANVERRVDLLNFLKFQFKELFSFHKKQIQEIIKEKREEHKLMAYTSAGHTTENMANTRSHTLVVSVLTDLLSHLEKNEKPNHPIKSK